MKMGNLVIVFAMMLAVPAGFSLAGTVDDNFDSLPVGQTFTNAGEQWQASSSSVVVTNANSASAPNAVVLPGTVTFSNSAAMVAPAVIWSDFRTIPAFGSEGLQMPTGECSLVSYVTADGYLSVWTNGGWLVCSQDIRGVAVDAFLPGAYAEVTFYQNFTGHVAAVLVNDRVVLQDLAMPASMTNYNRFVAANLDSSAYLDDVYIQTSYPSSRLSYDGNGDLIPDASELQLYGYVARTLTVGPSGGYPTFSGALAVARDRDRLQVNGTTFTEAVTLARSLTVSGVAFTNNGQWVLGEASTNVILTGLVCSNVVVGTNAVATFTNLVSYSNLTIRAGASVVADAVTCSNLLVEAGARFVCKGAFQCLGSSSFGQNALVSFSNTVTCAGAVSLADGSQVYLGQGATAGSLSISGVLTAGTGYGVSANWVDLNSSAALALAMPLDCSNLVVWSGTTATVANVTCSNMTVQADAGLTGLATILCRNQLLCTGTVTVAAGQSLTSASATVPGLVTVSAGATATVSAVLSLPVGGHVDVTQGAFLFPPLSAVMAGTFSLTNGWGQDNAITVSPAATCVFNQPLTNPPLSLLTLATASTSTLQAVTCTNLVAEAGARATILGAVQCQDSAVFGPGSVASFAGTVSCVNGLVMGTNSTMTLAQVLSCGTLLAQAGTHLTVAAPVLAGGTVTLENGVVASFSNTLACANALEVGADSVVTFMGAVSVTNGLTIDANATVTFYQPVTANDLVVRSGATVVFNTLACSNLTVEAGAHVTVGSTLACSGALSVASGASVSLLGDVTLGSFAANGSVTLTGGRPLVAGSMTLLGTVQANSSTVTVTSLSVPVGGSGMMLFTNGQLNVTSLGVTLSGTFSVDNTWGTQATVGLPFADTFDVYTANMSLQALGFRGWGANTNGVAVKAGEGASGSQAALLPPLSVLSNRIGSAATRVWTDYKVRPVPGVEPFLATTDRLAWHAYVNPDGRLTVWDNGVWVTCSNYLDGAAIPIMNPATFVRITLFMDYTLRTTVLFLDGKIIREMIPFPGGATVLPYSSFAVENLSGSAYLDDVTIGVALPAGLTADLDHDGIADGMEIQRFGSLTNPFGSVFTFR